MSFPVSPTWDILDFSGTSITSLISLPPSELTLTEPTSFSYSSALDSVLVTSTSNAELALNAPVPATFTVEITLRVPALPVNHADLVLNQVGVVVADDVGRGVALYLASTGLAVSRVDDYGSVSALPSSYDLISSIRSEFYTLRVAVVDSRAYVMVGAEGATPGVSFILPVYATPASAGDLVRLRAYGDARTPVALEVKAFRLSSTALIPDLPPIANAGKDQVAALGQAIRFDGRASFDTEGAALQYRWRLVDAPTGSVYAAEVSSGTTTDDGDSDGVTNRIDAGGALPSWVANGDVVSVAGGRYLVDSVVGTTLIVTSDTVPDNLEDVPFRIYRQSFFVDPTVAVPSALPDVAGLYRTELTVSDGLSWSEPAEVLASITATSSATGIEPDVSFFWRLLGDEWGLVEHRGLFEEAWKAVAQICSSLSLKVWQYQFNRSVRDVQRTFQHKWVSFTPLVVDDSPDAVEVRHRPGILYSGCMFESGTPLGVAGGAVVLEVNGTEITAVLPTATLSGIVAALNAVLPAGAEAIAYARNVSDPNYMFEGLADTSDDGDGNRVTSQITAGVLPSWIAAGDVVVCGGARSTVTAAAAGVITCADAVFPDDLMDATLRVYRVCRLGIYSSVPLRVLSAPSTLALESGYAYPHGDGSTLTSLSYYAPMGSKGVSVTSGDLLVTNNGQSLLVDRATEDPLDPYPGQRLLTLEEVPFDATGPWVVPSSFVTATDYESVGGYPGDLVAFVDDSTPTATRVYGTVVGLRDTVVGFVPKDSYWEAYVAGHTLTPLGVVRRKALRVPDETVAVPTLQDVIPVSASPVQLRENVDYILTHFYRDSDGGRYPVILFGDDTYVVPDVVPPETLWAEYCLSDNELQVENLYGVLTGFYKDDGATLPDDFNYTAGVAGLLYAYLRGPSAQAVATGAQILLGQPFAEKAGTIQEIRRDFSPVRGRILVMDDSSQYGTATVRAYYYKKDPIDTGDNSGIAVNPSTGAPWAVGDSVTQFAALGSGVSTSNHYTAPGWFKPYVAAGLMHELEKFHTYLIEFNLEQVSIANMPLLQKFADNTAPTYNRPLLVGALNRTEDIDLRDDTDLDVDLDLIDSFRNGNALIYGDVRGDGTIWAHHGDGRHYGEVFDSIYDTIALDLEADWAGGIITSGSIFGYGSTVTDVSGAHTGTPGSSFTVTFGMTLPAGTYRVTVYTKTGGVFS